MSWQAYHSADAAVTYSGDITDAPDGATDIGLDRPEGLPEDATVFTLANLGGLIPA